MKYFYWIYIAIVVLGFLKSLQKNDLLSVYFAVVLMVDSYMYLALGKGFPNIHPYAILFYCLFFVYYFRENFTKNLYLFLLTIIFLIGSVIIWRSEDPYDFRLILMMSIVYFCLPIIYFRKKLGEENQVSFTDRKKFWIATGLMIWIVVFLFKMIPLYIFSLKDRNFLIMLEYIFQVVNIVFYLLLLKSLFAKTDS